MFVRSFEFTDEAEVCLTGAADMDYGAEYHTRERRGARLPRLAGSKRRRGAAVFGEPGHRQRHG